MGFPHHLHIFCTLCQIMEYTAAGIIASLKEGFVDPALTASWIVNSTNPYELIQAFPAALVNEPDRITNELQEIISRIPAFTGYVIDLPRKVESLRRPDSEEPAGKRARFA